MRRGFRRKDTYGGNTPNKNVVRTLVFDHARAVIGTAAFKAGKIICLSGRDGLDVDEALLHGVKPKNIFTAEKSDEAYSRARIRLQKKGIGDIFLGDVYKMIQHHDIKNIAFLYLDFCNQVSTNTIQTFVDCACYTNNKSVCAATFVCGREGFNSSDAVQRRIGQNRNIDSNIDLDTELAKVLARISSFVEGVNNLLNYKFVPISCFYYMGTMPMFTILGILVKTKSIILEPEFFIYCSEHNVKGIHLDTIPKKLYNKIVPAKLQKTYERICS